MGFTSFDVDTKNELKEKVSYSCKEFINVFIDMGANRGDTIEEVLGFDKIPPIKYILNNKFHYYFFEPNPRFNDVLKGYCNRYTNYIKGCYYETAVTTFNGNVTFYEHETKGKRVNNTNYEGASLIPHRFKAKNEITVQSIDICEWIINTFDINNFDYYIIIKMDVEGYEYKLLTHIYDNCLQYIKMFFIEFHPWGSVYIKLSIIITSYIN